MDIRTLYNKGAIFTRVSTIDQSLTRQIDELKEYAEKAGIKVVATINETISGDKPNDQRQALQDLLKLAEEKKINKVLIHEVSRLGRNTAQVLTILEALHSHKVSVLVMNYNIETLNPDGSVNAMAQFIFTLLADIARMERITLIERVKSGMQRAKKEGKHLGRPEGSTIDEEEYQKKYYKVLRYLRSGYSIREVAKLLNVGTSTVQRVKKKLEL